MSAKYRILKIAACPFPYPRGTPVRIFKCAQHLSNLGHDVVVFTYSLGESRRDTNFKICRIPDVKTYRKLSAGPSVQKLLILDTILLAKIYKYLKNNKVDVIHAHHYEGLLIGLILKKRFKIPVIYDAHTILESELYKYYEKSYIFRKELLIGISKSLDKHLPSLADHIITVTDEIKEILVNKHLINSSMISVIPNGIENDFFTQNVKQENHPIRTLVYAGNLAAYQNIEVLLKVFSELLKIRQDVCLKIITKSVPSSLINRINTIGIREKTLLVEDDLDKLPYELSASNIAVNLRTSGDGVPLKLLNYMAAGLPTVSFEGSARYLTNMENSIIVKNGDDAGFVNSIDFLLDNPDFSNTLGQNAREYAMCNFSWQKTAKRIEQSYNNVVSVFGKH